MKSRPRLTRFLAVVGTVAIIFGIGGAVMGLVMMRKGFSARDEPSAAEALIARTMRTVSIPSRYSDMKSPVAVTAQVLDSAKAHWADHCASCHANDGSGSTTMGKNLFPKAPDMRVSPTQDLSDGQIYYIIENGIRLTGMPAWGDGKDDNQASWELVAFIRHLPRLTPEELKAMEALNPRPASAVNADEEDEAFLNDEGDTASPDHPDGGHPQ